MLRELGLRQNVLLSPDGILIGRIRFHFKDTNNTQLGSIGSITRPIFSFSYFKVVFRSNFKENQVFHVFHVHIHVDEFAFGCNIFLLVILYIVSSIMHPYTCTNVRKSHKLVCRTHTHLRTFTHAFSPFHKSLNFIPSVRPTLYHEHIDKFGQALTARKNDSCNYSRGVTIHDPCLKIWIP